MVQRPHPVQPKKKKKNTGSSAANFWVQSSSLSAWNCSAEPTEKKSMGQRSKCNAHAGLGRGRIIRAPSPHRGNDALRLSRPAYGLATWAAIWMKQILLSFSHPSNSGPGWPSHCWNDNVLPYQLFPSTHRRPSTNTEAVTDENVCFVIYRGVWFRHTPFFNTRFFISEIPDPTYWRISSNSHPK